jgi:cytochrome c
MLKCRLTDPPHQPPRGTCKTRTENIGMKNRASALALLVLAAPLIAAFGKPAAAADDGETLFRRYCTICHDTAPGKNKVGPSLAGIVGRKSGDEAGFSYSDAMQSAGVTWDATTIDKYLTDPKSFVAGNKMLFPGVKNADGRHAIIEYLKTLKG